MTDNQTPESREALREQIEEAAMYGFIEGAYDVHGIPVQSVDKLEDLITAATLASKVDGRRVQAEADLDKFLYNPDDEKYIMYLRKQIEAHKYELAILERQQLGKESSDE